MSWKFVVAMVAAAVMAAPAQGANPDSKLRKQLEQRKIRYETDADGTYRITYDLGNGRTQLAFVSSTINEYGSVKTREVRSIGYRAPADQFAAPVANRILEVNNQAKLGAFVKQGRFAVFTAPVPIDASAQQLADTIELCARLADELERELDADKDEF
jgi:hypothetical protein